MRQWIMAGIFSLTLATSFPAVANAQTETKTQQFSLNPHQLVSLARQGTFRELDIPGYSKLIAGYRTSSIEAEDLMRAAIETNRLLPNILSDRSFISAVEFELQRLAHDAGAGN
ncbi:hypothetical protein [Geitlerinema sp. PCC 9228]|jgi:hypothetical protein|uniref:hypothetical protein n=1 Tax=Geitlerinema sp. PCC 9228 TaxID=111611 RepID=UPI0008F9B078|nr:hypothetical protein [Geitlerinema sp. PCC 9228]